MDTGSLGFELAAIAKQLRERLLAVPIYQRSYSWEGEQVSDFCTDLRTAFSDNSQPYFLGTVVLSKAGVAGRDSVIDGQQRLATTAIFMAEVRNEFRQRADARRAQIIHHAYLSAPDLESAQDVPRLRLNSEDDNFFARYVIQGDMSVTPTRDSHKLILTASERIRTEVRKIADDAGPDWAKRLHQWVEYLASQVRIVVLEVSTEADAFLIFETLNDRGADLTIADLLKNYLFGRAGARLDTVRDGWIASLASLDITSENAVFTTFLRHYWSSFHGAVRERDLYKSIKEHVTTEAHAVQFIDDLLAASRTYAALSNSDHELWSTHGAGAKDNVETLIRFNLEQQRPLVLAALQHFVPGEVRKLLRSLVSWSVRGLIVGGIGGGTTERIYCEAAAKIRRGLIKTVADLFGSVAAIVPSDDEFQAAFSTARIPRGTLARYYLLAMERTKRGDPEPELVPNANEEQVNLEHVLPRNATDLEWGTSFNQEERRDWLHRLGNLCLLQKKPNGRIGNKAFAVKRPILAASALELTKEVGNTADWTPTTIAERQNRLALLAVKTWPRKP